MRNRTRGLLPAIVLACASLGSGIPDSLARSGDAYGPAVDTACQEFNGTTPFADQSCGLCHAGGNLGQRVEPEWTWWETGDLTAFCPEVANQAPNGRIDAPAADQTVTAGESVDFRGSGSDPDGDPIAAYRWDFGGGAPSSTLQDPGNVPFNTAGTFTVTFTVTDGRGLSDPTPDTRRVTVEPATTGNRPPDGTIDTPATDQSIGVGEAVSFAGSGSDPDGDPVSFLWNFGGAAPDATVRNPGSVLFSTAGSFTVTFTVTDDSGLADPTPDTRIITVRPAGAACSDADSDGFAVEGGICGPEDCDDTDPEINPAAAEACADGIDNDCDLFIDDTDSECNGGDCIAELFGDDEVPLTIDIETAVWNAGEQELEVQGTWDTLGALVTVTNAVTGNILGTTVVERDDGRLEWEFELNGPATVPCRVRVEIDGEFGELDVTNAPADCAGGPGGPSPANQPPDANDDAAVTDAGIAVTIEVLANDSDPDGDALSITTVSAPANGSVSTDGTRVRYAPASGFNGTDAFGYTVSDGNGGTAPASVSVTVRAAPLPPAFEVDIEKATWNRGQQQLTVEGRSAPPGSTVNLYNASTTSLLATTTAQGDGEWEFRVISLSPAPCRVRVEIRSAGQVAVGESEVSRAPRDCR